MKKLFTTLFIASCLLITKVDLFAKTQKNLSSQIFIYERKNIPIVNIILLSTLGSSQIDENGGEGQLLKLILDKSSITKKLESLGVLISIYSGKDSFSLSMIMLKEQTHNVLKLIFKELSFMKIAKKDLELAKKEQIASIDQMKSSPASRAYQDYISFLFNGHPYGKNAYSKKQIEQISLSQVQKAFKNIFSKEYMRIIAVGDSNNLKKSQIISFLQKVQSSQFNQKPITSATSVKQDVIVNQYLKDLTQSFINIGFTTPSYNLETVPYYLILQQIIGGGFSSRLFKELREKRGLTYSPSAIYRPYKHLGSFSIVYSTKNSNITESLSVVKQILSDIKLNGVDKEELIIAKKIILTDLSKVEETNSSMSQVFINSILYNLDPFYYKVVENKIKSINLIQINKFIKNVLTQAYFVKLVLQES